MLGESAGRSSQARQRGTARRRFSIEERAANTPLPDDVQEWPDDEAPPRFGKEVLQDVLIGLLVLLSTCAGLGMANSTSPLWQGFGMALIVITGTCGWFMWINQRRRSRTI